MASSGSFLRRGEADTGLGWGWGAARRPVHGGAESSVQRSKAAVVLWLRGGGYGEDKGVGGLRARLKGKARNLGGARTGKGWQRSRRVLHGWWREEKERKGKDRRRQVGPDYQRERAAGMTEKRRKAAGMIEKRRNN
jgi:hypothetical protein